jgi:hypothetical protein
VRVGSMEPRGVTRYGLVGGWCFGRTSLKPAEPPYSADLALS